MESPLEQELRELKARATRLEQEIDKETDRDMKLARLAELTALRNQIAALQNEITERRKSRGNFHFLRVKFYFLLEFIYFLWP